MTAIPTTPTRPTTAAEYEALRRKALGVGRWRAVDGVPTFVYSIPPDADAAIACIDALCGPPRRAD